MNDITRIDVKIKATNVNEAKSTFDEAEKIVAAFFRTSEAGWKKSQERTKESQAATEKMAKKVSGDGKDDLAGAFKLAGGLVRGFAKGMAVVLSAKEIIEMGAKAVEAFGDIEEGRNRLLATGKVNLEQIKHLEHEWHEWGPTVRKPITELHEDYAHILSVNPKLADHFKLMEQWRRVTGANWTTVVQMVNTAMVNGVKPQDLHSYLNTSAKAFEDLGEAGVVQSARVSQALAKNGIQGAEVQRQVNMLIGSLADPMLGADKAADAVIKFFDKLTGGGTDSMMQRAMEPLRLGKVTLIQFFDDMITRTDELGVRFQDALKNDPLTRELVYAWKAAREKLKELKEAAGHDFTKNPLLQESTAIAIERFTEALKALFVAIGEELPTIRVLNLLAEIVNATTDRVNVLKGGLQEFKDTSPNLDNFRWIWQGGIPGLTSGLGPRPAPAPPPSTPWPASKMTPAPGDVPPMAEGGRGPGLAQVGERGGEAIVGPEGVRREVNQATIVTLGEDEAAVPGLVGSGPDRRVNPKDLYDNLLSKFSKSSLAGVVPPGAEKYGINTGAAEEYATLGVANAMSESGIKAGLAPDPGDAARHLESIGLYQFDQRQVKRWGGGGDAYDPEASATAFVNYMENRALGPGTTWKGGSGKGIDALGDTFSTFRHGGGATMQNIGYARRIAGAGHGINTAGGSLEESSGEAPKGGYDIPDRYRPQQTEQAWRPTVKPKVEIVPPERHEIERAARSTTSRARSIGRREQQSAHAGRIGHM
jgi:hypothetical protein